MKAVFACFILFSLIAGIFFAPYFDISSVGLFALFAIFFLVSLSVIPQKWLWLAMIAIGFFFLGILRFELHKISLEKVFYPKDQETIFRGQVVEPPEDTKKATKIVVSDNEKGAKILLILKPFSGIKYGDYLQVKGRAIKPENESAKNSLLARGITHEMLFPEIQNAGKDKLTLSMQAKSLLYSLRNRFEESINRILPEPESSFLAGLLLGIKRNLPDWLMEDLKVSGTTHLIALSGFNITIIIEGLRLIFSKKSARLSFFVPLAAIAGFVIMTGSQSSVVRAGIMGSMMLLAHRIGRQSSAAMAIIITAAAMVLINPMILRFDTGFQLSFAAFMGIIYLGPIFKNLLPIKNKSIHEIISMTLGAQVMAYPIILYYFGSFSSISLFTNLIVLPFIPVIMLLGFISAALGTVWSGLGHIFSWTALFALRGIIAAIKFSANLPYASFEGIGFSALNLAIYYIIVLELIIIYENIRKRRLLGTKK
ncbi:ComEC family competence protein [candidate division WS5 bacterium]|uniref:ComEC family competence protein n=1 Tax=candidate division WS5 bacterium TaxID=2093353 RepID=A0A419DFW2_9BACT|nr:MAG: ComEC family competence protein [candidate division WS5 bacterium]